MKKNKIIIMLFIMIFAFSVKANEWWEVYTTIEKSEDASELYNLMPTEVKKGETISVKLVVKKGNGLKLSNLDSEITWDKEAFELIETNGKYYRELKKDVECNIYFGKSENSVNLHCYFNENSTISDSEDIIELKFKAKNNVNDGIYEIKQNYNNDGIGIFTEDDYKTSISTDKQLKYQVGKPKLISEYANENIENSSYIIGDYLFTRKGSDEYNGILTTDYIMLASPSIRSKNKEDMIVYAKNARGKWINAITNESITPPEEFKISYIDMIANYRENGVYSDGSYKTKLGLVQINENEAIIIIESTDEKIHGIASIKDRVATLKVNKKNYIITISDNEVNIETNDNYIGNKKLLKRANYSVNDYYDDYYSYRNEYGGSRYYLNSSHTGKYVNNNYEIYIYRISDSCSKICLKKRNDSECIIDTLQFTNYYNEIEFDGIPSTYEFGLEETQYGVLIEENGLRIKSIGNSESPYQGTYKKESSLSMDEIFHIWEKNEVYYRVEFDENNEYQEIYYEYILENSELGEGDWSYFYPYKEGYDFIGWFLNDEQYYVDSIITKPITLVAAYQIKTYSVDFDTNGGTSINTIIISHGGKILRPDDPIKEGHTFVGWQLNGQDYNFNTPVTDNITLTAVWSLNEEEKQYTFKVNKVDDYSPDRRIVVYEDGTEIEFNSIVYNNVTLCNGEAPNVNFYDIDGINSVTVILTNGVSVTATLDN